MKHEISELLPFYANGTLDASDHARVEHELATCTACAQELDELRGLGETLRVRAAGAPPPPGRLLDDALARIALPPAHAAAARIRGAWWGAPARYATAATIVLTFGLAAAAAWHARGSGSVEDAYAVKGNATSAEHAATVFRVSPGPSAQKLMHRDQAPAPEPQAPAQPRHRLAKRASIELLVRDVETSLKQVQATVRGTGGDVTALDDASPRTGGTVHGATLEAEVPAQRLDASLDALAALGAVQNRRIDAEDVDATIVDEEARLRNLRREEADLRKLMDKGGKVGEILTVQQSLSDVRGQIEQLAAQHQNDVHRVAVSTISVALTEDRPNAAPARPGPTARIDGAWHAGLNALTDTLIAWVSAIAWCAAYSPIPLGLGAAVYAALRVLRRRATAA